MVLKLLNDWFGVYLQRRLIVIALLGFSCGIPYFLTSSTLCSGLPSLDMIVRLPVYSIWRRCLMHWCFYGLHSLIEWDCPDSRNTLADGVRGFCSARWVSSLACVRSILLGQNFGSCSLLPVLQLHKILYF